MVRHFFESPNKSCQKISKLQYVPDSEDNFPGPRDERTKLGTFVRHAIWFLCLTSLVSLVVTGIWALFPLIPKEFFGTNGNETLTEERELTEAEKNLTRCQEGKFDIEQELGKSRGFLKTSEAHRMRLMSRVEDLESKLITIKSERYDIHRAALSL